MATELKYLLFLGCAIPYRVSSYEISTRKVFSKLGIQLHEMPEFNCCGLPLDPVNHDMMLALAARNLCLAEQKGMNIVALCPGCAGTLRKVNKLLKEDKEMRNHVNALLKDVGLEFKGTIEAKHLAQALAEDYGLERLKDAVTNPLTNLKVAQHLGCHVMRPAKAVDVGDPENPELFKKLIEATGATCLEYIDETQCCGAPIAGVNDKIPLQLSGTKLTHVKAVGAQALITVCPFCHMMFDTNQMRIEKLFNETFRIPVVHYTQLLGLALGIAPEELAFKELRVDSSQLLASATAKT